MAPGGSGVLAVTRARRVVSPRSLRRLVKRERARARVLRPSLLGPQPLTPISRSFGFGRGTPVDRRYIEDFLARHGAHGTYSPGDIVGEVMEIGDDTYTRRFGHAELLRSIDVLHAADGNPKATLVGDLASGDGLPRDRYDCIICTQTLQSIYRVQDAVHTLYQALRPEGVVLATVPGISQALRPDRDQWGDYWRFTTTSARKVFEEAFPAEEVKVEAYGNLVSATAFLHGLVVEDLLPQELDPRDPDYELLIAIRARRPG